jgi:hypothetical protein
MRNVRGVPSVRVVALASLPKHARIPKGPIIREPEPGALPETMWPLDVDVFRDAAFEPEAPLLMKAAKNSDLAIPKYYPGRNLRKWLRTSREAAEFTPYIKRFTSSLPLHYELLLPSTKEPLLGPVYEFVRHLSASEDPSLQFLGDLVRTQISDYAEQTGERFIPFDAPLSLMLAAMQFNEGRPPVSRLKQLYIAQASLNTLPEVLKRDFRAPEIVKKAGKGDIYSSSLWLGLQPTYTPWHRDPNPNLFHQVWGTKEVRILPPRGGITLLLQTRAKFGINASNTRIRGPEMMEGLERKAMHGAVWGPGAHENLYKASLEPGDTLFIPKGWWHSLRSTGAFGSVNASVNWWFR